MTTTRKTRNTVARRKTKAKASNAEPKKSENNPNELRVTSAVAGEPDEACVAKIAYDPAARSLAGARRFIANTMGEQPLTESLKALTAQVKEVQSGSLEIAEKTLVVQANTLDAIFNELGRRAALNMGEHLDATERYLRLALKAQSQCRATLETLATIKNPPVIYARQANVTTGPQQVNNGNAVPSHGGKVETEQNKQSEAGHELLPDNRASQAESRVDTQMGTVEKIHGPEIGGGQGSRIAERIQGGDAGDAARP